jgi:hypothetical protein
MPWIGRCLRHAARSMTFGKPSSGSVHSPHVVQPVGSFSSFSVKAVSTETQTKSMSGNLPSLVGIQSCQYSRLMMPPFRGTGALLVLAGVGVVAELEGDVAVEGLIEALGPCELALVLDHLPRREHLAIVA